MRILTSFFLAIFLTALSQAQPRVMLIEDVLEAFYPGGQESFFNYVYLTVRYPYEARHNCQMGVVYMAVEIDKDGNIALANVMNEPYEALAEETRRVIYSTNGKWKNHGMPVKFVWEMGFEIGTNEEIGGYTKVSAMLLSGGCKTRTEMEERLKKYLEKGKEKKAKKYLSDLMKRYPREMRYKEMWEELENLNEDE